MTAVYPEHDKLDAAEQKCQLITDFLDFAAMRDVVFGTHSDTGDAFWFVPTRKPELDKLLARFFGVDWTEFQAEEARIRAEQEGTPTCHERASDTES